MAYTFRIAATIFDGSTGATRLPPIEDLQTVEDPDGQLVVSRRDGAPIAALGVIDPRILWTLATTFPQRPAPVTPRDYVVIQLAARDDAGVPAGITFDTWSETLKAILSPGTLGPGPLPLGQQPGPLLVSGYLLAVDQPLGQGPSILELTLEALTAREVFDAWCCLDVAAGGGPP